MRCLGLYLVLVFVLLFILLCIIVSLSLFATLIQVSFDDPPWTESLSSASRSEFYEYENGDTNTESLAKSHLQIQSLLKENERLEKELEKLRIQIANLSSQQAGKTMTTLKNIEARNSNDKKYFFDESNAANRLNATVQNSNFEDSKRIGGFKSQRLESAANRSEEFRPVSEHDVIPFARFNAMRLYLVESGFERRVVEKPNGYRKAAIETAIDFSLERLNERRSRPEKENHTRAGFLEGVFRAIPGVGEQYELYFADKKHSRYNRLTVARFLSEPIVISSETILVRKELIFMIVPLSGRVDSFQKFMERFVRVVITGDKKVYLTVVYFGQQGLKEVETIVRKVSFAYDYKAMRILSIDGKFSRGKALREGVTRCPIPGDVLVFFCDVDVMITTDFLERCRVNSDRGQRVYYPIVFSFYNPSVVSTFLGSPTSTVVDETVVLSEDNGFWRDFGYGMVCHFRSDFLRVNGFDETIHGWGLEDVFLYRKYLRSNLTVIRATDPGIVHLWHEKICDASLPSDQYRNCIRSKALNEGSNAQLGMLVFKRELDIHRNMTN